jgi:hypothetical protein
MTRLENQQPIVEVPKLSVVVDRPSKPLSGINQNALQNIEQVEADLWAAVGNLRANSKLTAR